VAVHEVVARVLEQKRHLTRPLDAPARGLGEALCEPQERALARAVAAHERDALAWLELERDAAQDRGAVVYFEPEVLEAERRVGAFIAVREPPVAPAFVGTVSAFTAYIAVNADTVRGQSGSDRAQAGVCLLHRRRQGPEPG
jgi:hypothetical protein